MSLGMFYGRATCNIVYRLNSLPAEYLPFFRFHKAILYFIGSTVYVHIQNIAVSIKFDAIIVFH